MVIAWALAFASCRTLLDSSGTPSGKETPERSPEIIFLNYSITSDPVTGEYRVAPAERITSAGRLKEPYPESVIPAAGDLEMLILDERSEVLHRSYIQDPLHRTVEYVTARGRLAQKEVHHDSAGLFLRLQLEPAAHSLVLKRITGTSDESIHLITTPLK